MAKRKLKAVRQLQEFKRENDLSFNELSGMLGVSVATVNNWLNGKYTPDSNNLDRIKQLLKEPNTKVYPIAEEVKELEAYRVTHGMSYAELERVSGIDGKSFNKWVRGVNNITENSLKRVKDFLNMVRTQQASIEITLDSRVVAEKFDVRHADLMRDIETYIGYLQSEAIRSKADDLGMNLENEHLRSLNYFIPDTYKVANNRRTYPCYQITKKGCEFLANKLSGEKGALFTAWYINEFHRMKEALQSEDKPTTHPTDQKQPKQLNFNLEESPELSYIKQRVKNFDKCRDLKQCLFELLSLYRVLKVLINEEGGTLANELQRIEKKIEEEKEGRR